MNSVSDLFKALSSGFLKYVFAWLIPSLVTTAAFVVLVLPDIRTKLDSSQTTFVSEADSNQPGATQSPNSSDNPDALSAGEVLVGTALFALTVVTLSTLFGLLSTPIYRVLEGYHLPRDISRRFVRSQQRRRLRLERLLAQRSASEAAKSKAAEELDLYPSDPKQIMPTRLGNAFKATETYAETHYGMDSQRLWFELASLAPQSLREDIDNARGPIDFFISFLTHLALLAITALSVAAVLGSGTSLAVGLVSALLVPAAYHGAVRNMDEYRSAIQALVNVGRTNVVLAFGLRRPVSSKDEVQLWEGLTKFASPAHGVAFKGLSNLDNYRASPRTESRRRH